MGRVLTPLADRHPGSYLDRIGVSHATLNHRQAKKPGGAILGASGVSMKLEAGVTLADCFGIGLTLTLIGAGAVALEYSPLARTKFFRDWIFVDAPGNSPAARKRSSLVLCWCCLFAGHVMLAVGAVWWLTTAFPE